MRHLLATILRRAADRIDPAPPGTARLRYHVDTAQAIAAIRGLGRAVKSAPVVAPFRIRTEIVN